MRKKQPNNLDTIETSAGFIYNRQMFGQPTAQHGNGDRQIAGMPVSVRCLLDLPDLGDAAARIIPRWLGLGMVRYPTLIDYMKRYCGVGEVTGVMDSSPQTDGQRRFVQRVLERAGMRVVAADLSPQICLIEGRTGAGFIEAALTYRLFESQPEHLVIATHDPVLLPALRHLLERRSNVIVTLVCFPGLLDQTFHETRRHHKECLHLLDIDRDCRAFQVAGTARVRKAA